MTENEACALIVDAETARHVAKAQTIGLVAWQAAYASLQIAFAIRSRVSRNNGLSHGSSIRLSNDDDDSDDRHNPEPDPTPFTPDEGLKRLFKLEMILS